MTRIINAEELRDAINAAIDSVTVPEEVTCVACEFTKWTGIKEVRVSFQTPEVRIAFQMDFNGDGTIGLIKKFVTTNEDTDCSYIKTEEFMVGVADNFKQLGVEFKIKVRFSA